MGPDFVQHLRSTCLKLSICLRVTGFSGTYSWAQLHLDLGSESLNIRKQMHRRLFIFMIKGISHQSHINKETLFIEYDIKIWIPFKYWEYFVTLRIQVLYVILTDRLIREVPINKHTQKQSVTKVTTSSEKECVFCHRRKWQWGKKFVHLLQQYVNSSPQLPHYSDFY